MDALDGGATLKVGYIGLGNMGSPMAVNLAKAGFDLLVFDRRADSMASIEAHGARAATSVAEVAASVDVLCTCVLYDQDVRDIFLGDGGILEHARPGLVATIHSTVLPQTVQEIDAAAAARGIMVADAPVSGGRKRSEQGTLTLIVGARDEAVAKAKPVFDVIGGPLFRVGLPGTAQVVKLGNNIMGLANILVAMEAVRFVEAFGVTKEMLFEVANVSSGASSAIEDWAKFDRYGREHTLAGTDELPFRIAKDLRYSVSLAEARSTTMPIIALCSQLMPGMFEDRWEQDPGRES